MEHPILKELLQQQRHGLSHFFDSMNTESLSRVLEEMLNCKGNIVLTGIGKSGIVAKKISVTMTSTGTRAFYLSPANALHGDIGILNKNDLFVVLSKSGESDELMNLIPFVRNQGIKVVAVVCNKKSRLAEASDVILEIPAEKELCPFDMAPTTSTTIQGIVGDVLAIAMMKIKNFSFEDFVKSHPAGRLGKRATVLVKDLMIMGNNIPFASPQDSLVDSLVELSNKQCGCVIIVDDEGKMLGIFTDGDLRRALQMQGVDVLHCSLESLMTKNPKSIGPDVLAYTAAKKMESNQKSPVMVLPVVDDDKRVVGIIKMHDLIQSGVL